MPDYFVSKKAQISAKKLRNPFVRAGPKWQGDERTNMLSGTPTTGEAMPPVALFDL